MGEMIRGCYWLGVLSAAAAVLYRGLTMLGLASGWREATGVAPYNFLQLAVLALLLCLATEVYARQRSAG